MTLKQTGPGEYEAQPLSPDITDGNGLYVVLYNFDHDGSTLKDKHKDWLRENVLPTLQVNAKAHVEMIGSASKVGSADYNRNPLSKQRMEEVKQFLLRNGARPGQVPDD